MGTNCAPLVADLFIMRDFMLSFSDNNQAEAFNSTSRHLDDLLNFDNPYFKQVAQWATIAHHEASIMFGDTIIYDAQRQVTLNLKQ